MHQSDNESAAHTSNSQQQQQQQVSHRGTAILDSPMAPALEPLYKKLDLDEGESVSTQQLADKLKAMGELEGGDGGVRGSGELGCTSLLGFAC